MPPCYWPIIRPPDCPPENDLLDLLLDPEDAESGTRREALDAMAVELLWRWTGSTYGACSVEVRPCREKCLSSASWLTVGRGARAGAWCGSCGPTACGCTRVPRLRLRGPVALIEEVWDSGTLLDEDSYYLDGNDLIRADGENWPLCQDLLAGPEDEDAFTIRYKQGLPVPMGGRIAAGRLACELAKAALGDSCDLPQRVQTVTRQGVTVALLDSFDDVDRGKTGLWEVDSWVSAVTRSPARPRVWSPELAGRRATTRRTEGLLDVAPPPPVGTDEDNLIRFTQGVPAMVWGPIIHNFGTLPASVEVLDSSGNEIVSTVERTATTVTIRHGLALSGSVLILRY